MTTHSRRDSQQVIDSLLVLGKALLYTAESEWRLEPGTAAIDVSWIRRPGDRVPLIAFEVETTASGGIASNALKVLGKPSDQLRKPLHLFHIVVSGGLRSDRPVDATAAFGAHNYSIHLMDADDEPKHLLRNILDVHSRVADRVNGIQLLSAIAEPPWPPSLLDDTAECVRRLGLLGVSERCLVLLSQKNPDRYLPLLARRIREIWQRELSGEIEPPNLYLEPVQPREEEYGSYMASVACEAIELGLIASLEASQGPAALRVLRRWQQINHIGDKVGPYTGAGTQWTQYEIENLGYMWAVIASLMFEVPGAARWCAEQPASLLAELPETDAGEVLLLTGWVLHLSAASGADDIYESARARLARAGGISASWLGRPEPGSPGEDGDWSVVFRNDRVAPTNAELVNLVEEAGSQAVDPVGLALSALVQDPVLFPDLGAILAATLLERSRG